MDSGLAPGGRAAKSGRLVISGGSFLSARGSGRVTKDRGEGELSFAAEPPNPETPLFAGGLPPLTLTPMASLPGPTPAVPPGLSVLPLAFPLAAGALLAEPPGTPGCFPSGEMEMRAERFPWGGCTLGAGGAGVAERAMNPGELALTELDCEAPTSGAGPTSPVCLRSATRGRRRALIRGWG